MQSANSGVYVLPHGRIYKCAVIGTSSRFSIWRAKNKAGKVLGDFPSFETALGALLVRQ